LYFEDDDMEEIYKLTTTIRGNSMQGRISIDSPLGGAINGHKVGDRVHVKVNDNYSFYVQVRKIEAGDDEDDLRKY
jgi:transcription elongation factor GreA